MGKDLVLMVGEMINGGATLVEIIRKIEVMFGGLKTPEQAQMECHKACRYSGETLMQLGRRIKHLAYMASRLKANPRESAEQLGMETFLAVIPLELRQQLKALNDKKLGLSQKAMDFETLISEAKRLEDEKRTEIMVAKSRYSNKGYSSIRQVTAYDDPYAEPEQETPDYEEGGASIAYTESGEVLRVYNNTTPRKNPFYSNNKRPGNYQQRYKNANRKPENKYNPAIRQVEDDSEYYFDEEELQAMDLADIDVAGSCLYIPAGNGDRQNFIKVDPKALHVSPHECLKCGKPGHRAFGPQNIKCPLRNQPMITKPCPACNKGGHVAAVCPDRSKN